MRRILRVAVMTTTLLIIPSAAFAAEEVSVTEIVDMSAELAMQEVIVEGELVGDYGFRDDGSMWSQLNGDSYATAPLREGGTPVGGNIGIGVRIPAALADGLDPPGGYRYRGPVIRVTGVWKHHDPARQGESYLEVGTMTVIEDGRQLVEGVNWVTVVAGTLLLAGAGVVALVTRRED